MCTIFCTASFILLAKRILFTTSGFLVLLFSLLFAYHLLANNKYERKQKFLLISPPLLCMVQIELAGYPPDELP